MTLEYRGNGHPGGRKNVVTIECGLCGQSLRERQGMSDHLPNCPVREIYAERGALRNGGPDPTRIQAAIDTHDGHAVATDGGESP